jgi:GT2 family glycosyltransferase
MRPVTVVIPALGDVALLERALPPLFGEFDARGGGDELVLIDDTGTGVLAAHAEALFAGRDDARLVERETNGGFAAALEAGVAAAASELVFSMNSDVVVRPGFLAPLVEAVDGSCVFAAAPRVLLNGKPDRIESFPGARLEAGLLDFRRADPGPVPDVVTPIPFAVGGTFLFDRAVFLELGGFDPLFAPFYFEDNDLCWRAWRRGHKTLFVPTSIVEHHHKGTIGKLVSEARRRAAVERGELLFNWKHLPAENLADHMALLFQRVLDSYLTDDRAGLVWLALALEKLDAAMAGRAELEGDLSSLEVLERLSARPTGA